MYNKLFLRDNGKVFISGDRAPVKTNMLSAKSMMTWPYSQNWDNVVTLKIETISRDNMNRVNNILRGTDFNVIAKSGGELLLEKSL